MGSLWMSCITENLMRNKASIKTAIVCHDAGGAEILSSYIQQNHINCLCVLDGPAVNIFKRKLGEIKIIPLRDAIYYSQIILCGTSWQSDLEVNAIKLAHELGKHSIAFIDHWVNYRERFFRSDALFLPNEIWVGDKFAVDLAKNAFPTVPVTLVENPYFKDIKKEIDAFPGNDRLHSLPLKILYVCEPIASYANLCHGDSNFFGYTEDDALHFFLTNISAVGSPIENILIRPHPSELPDKYNWNLNNYDLPIKFSRGEELYREVMNSDIVVGCQSMAMIVALLAGKRVVSCIPPSGKSCALPYKEIISLRDVLTGEANL